MDYSSTPAADVAKACATSTDVDAWAEFVRRFQPLIASVAFKTARIYCDPAPGLVDDLVQETYLKLCGDRCRLLQEFEPSHSNSIYGYLKVVTANLVYDHFKSVTSVKRGGRSRAVDLDHGLQESSTQHGSLTATDMQVLSQQVDRILRQHLERRDLLAFWLYYRSGLSAKEIAAIPEINLSVKGVESLLIRAVRLLRRELFESRAKESTRPRAEDEGLRQA